MVGGLVLDTEGLGRTAAERGPLSVCVCWGWDSVSEGTYAIGPPASEAFGLRLGPGGHCRPGSPARRTDCGILSLALT